MPKTRSFVGFTLAILCVPLQLRASHTATPRAFEMGAAYVGPDSAGLIGNVAWGLTPRTELRGELNLLGAPQGVSALVTAGPTFVWDITRWVPSLYVGAGVATGWETRGLVAARAELGHFLDARWGIAGQVGVNWRVPHTPWPVFNLVAYRRN